MRFRRSTLLLALGAGVAIAATSVAMILWVSNDMRWLLGVGAAGLLGASWWLGRREGGIVAVAAVALPLILLFSVLVLPQLPALWPHLLFWACFAGAGLLGARRRRASTTIAAVVALVAAAAWYSSIYVPQQVSLALNQPRNEPAPLFTLDRLDGGEYPVSSLGGKVVVLDFFATWCAPCIAELPEIDSLYRRYAAAPDVEILVIANDSGGDTPAAIRGFLAGRDLEVPFAYDPEGRAHRAFGLVGLPGLVVIDKASRVRLTREGYNAAETDFEENLVRVIELLRRQEARPPASS